MVWEPLSARPRGPGNALQRRHDALACRLLAPLRDSSMMQQSWLATYKDQCVLCTAQQLMQPSSCHTALGTPYMSNARILLVHQTKSTAVLHGCGTVQHSSSIMLQAEDFA